MDFSGALQIFTVACQILLIKILSFLNNRRQGLQPLTGYHLSFFKGKFEIHPIA
jgi:hypothetical protein